MSETNITLLSTAQLLELLSSIYLHLNVKTITADPTDKILVYNRSTAVFATASFEDMWRVTDPVRGLIDNLLSTKTDYALTANQGRVLKDLVDIEVEDIRKLIDALQVLCDGLEANKLNNVPTDGDLNTYFDIKPIKDSRKFLTSGVVKTAIDTAVSSLFKFKGSTKIVNNVVVKLDDSVVELVVGNVYNNTTAGKIFKNNVDATQGLIDVKLNENICWTDDGWDELGGTCDLSEYATMVWVTDQITAVVGVIGLELDKINRTIV